MWNQRIVHIELMGAFVHHDCPSLAGSSNHQPWLRLLHLLATHRPARLQHEYTTVILQIGLAHPVQDTSRNMGNGHSYLLREAQARVSSGW